MKKALSIIAGLVLLGAVPAWAQGLAGVYRLSQQGTTITLEIKQNPDNSLSGSLSSSTGAKFVLQGRRQGQVGQGTLRSAGGGSFFQARRQGDRLLLALINPDAQGRPDPKQVRQLVLVRQDAAPQPPAAGNVGSIGRLPNAGAPNSTAAPRAQAQPQPRPPAATTAPPRHAASQAGPAPGELGHDQWGFAFRPPAGWKYQVTPRAIIFGHDQIAGVIIVLPHLEPGLEAVRAEMTKGMQEGSTRMGLMSPLRPLGSNGFIGQYQGSWEGQPARGLGIGTYSPHGGGAMIIAVTSPQKFGNQLTAPATEIAGRLRYFKVDDSALKKHFAGYWWRYSGNAQLSRESIIQLAPDGTYRDRHESAANVANRDAQGHVTSQYLGHSHQRKRGRWTVRGTKEQGIIFVTRSGGTSFELAYRVKPARPQKYGSYYFNGQIHHWVTPKQLRDLGY